MRRFNGWGEESISHSIPDSAIPKLQLWVGPGLQPLDITLEDLIATVPTSRLPEHPLINTAAEERVYHARGQSLPDWIAMRSGQVGIFPDGVAQPRTGDEVRNLIDWAVNQNVNLIPYGGGTSVVGHINPQISDRPCLSIDLGRMNQLEELDRLSRLATFGAGIRGPDLEAHLRAHGLTLGHFPQSFEYSTLGGWVATRSTGQQSYLYGKIERLFAGGQLESPAGSLTLPVQPATAAGPDLRELVLGSEGRLGILTRVTVRVNAVPQEERFHALFFPDFDSGLSAVRKIAQDRIPVSMLRLSTATETATNLALAGREGLINLLERGLSLRGSAEEKCMLMLGVSGTPSMTRHALRTSLSYARKHGAIHVGRYMGSQWHRTRFTTPYLRNSLWEMGYAIDTLETAGSWKQIPGLITSIERKLRSGLVSENERVHVFTHISHVYPDGASIYTTLVFRVQSGPEKTLAFWKKLKSAASQAIVSQQATISHQHGVGTDHAAYLEAEKGKLGLATLGLLCQLYDPSEIMNPGKLVKNTIRHVLTREG